MAQSDDGIRHHASMLADEITSSLQQGRAVEWLEEVLGGALLAVARGERERCAAVADRRIEMWEGSLRRMESGTWPGGAVARGTGPSQGGKSTRGRASGEPLRTIGELTLHWAGTTAGAPCFFTSTTTNRAGLVVLAFRPTTCTSSGPS
jgi:hypothetical protein